MATESNKIKGHTTQLHVCKKHQQHNQVAARLHANPCRVTKQFVLSYLLRRMYRSRFSDHGRSACEGDRAIVESQSVWFAVCFSMWVIKSGVNDKLARKHARTFDATASHYRRPRSVFSYLLKCALEPKLGPE